MDLPCLPDNFDARMHTREEVAALFAKDPRTQIISRWIRMASLYEAAAYTTRVAIADAERAEDRMRNEEIPWPDMQRKAQ